MALFGILELTFINVPTDRQNFTQDTFMYDIFMQIFPKYTY